MQLADQSAIEAFVMQRLANQSIFVMAREGAEAVAIDADSAGVHAGQKAGAARRADGRLAKGMREGGGFADKAIEIGRVDMLHFPEAAMVSKRC